MYQIGWPDLYAIHPVYGHRWIEMKAPDGKLRPSQIKMFTEWSKYKGDVWILRDEKDYDLLFKGSNWWQWLDKDLRING
jgi:hypothetical protein